MKKIKFIIEGRYGKVSVILSRKDFVINPETNYKSFNSHVSINEVEYLIDGILDDDNMPVLSSVCAFEITDIMTYSYVELPVTAMYLK